MRNVLPCFAVVGILGCGREAAPPTLEERLANTEWACSMETSYAGARYSVAHTLVIGDRTLTSDLDQRLAEEVAAAPIEDNLQYAARHSGFWDNDNTHLVWDEVAWEPFSDQAALVESLYEYPSTGSRSSALGLLVFFRWDSEGMWYHVPSIGLGANQSRCTRTSPAPGDTGVKPG